MSSSVSDLISIGYKRAVYGALIVTCITPGILYLYLKDPSSYASLAITKTILFGLGIASPVIVFNMFIAFATVYLSFSRKQYQQGKRLKEEILNRVILTSSILSTSLSLNLGVICLYFLEFKPSLSEKILALLADIVFVIICIFLLKKKVDLDLFHHDFPG